jgi:myo-inositol-1(or 4)-monophosphatase
MDLSDEIIVKTKGQNMTEELKFLIDIVRNAEKISNENFTVKTKGGENDLVTNLDVKIEEYLIGEIKENYPNFDIVSEEENFEKIPTDNCFIIDPIDGTINFANNVPLWAIQIACKKGGKTVASVIDMSRINEFYYADETGAYLNGNKISVSQVPIKNALYAIDGNNNNLQAINRMHKYSSNRRIFGGVCVSMAFASAGRIHGAVYRNDKPWDYEPGLFLIKMAGGETMSIPGFHAGAMNKEFLDILKLETSKKAGASNVFVLHSLNGDTLKFWGQDVKEYATDKGIGCCLPEFPIREESSYEKFDEILSTYLNTHMLNSNSIVIAHSIGNPYFIRFCREHNFLPKAYVAVAPGAVYEYPIKRNDYIVSVKKQAYLTKPDFEFAKNLKNVYMFYSDEDDGNREKFSRFEKDFNAKAIYLKGYNHFDGYHRIYKIPELVKLIDELV